MYKKWKRMALLLTGIITLGSFLVPSIPTFASERDSQGNLILLEGRLHTNLSDVENSFEASNTRIQSGYYVTQTQSGKIDRAGPNSIKFDGKINGKRHVGTLYFQSSTLNKTSWTYTWTYYGMVTPK